MELNEITVPQKTKKIYWVRMILCSVALCFALALFYGIYVSKILNFMSYLTENEMPNIVWVVENVFSVLPAFLTLFIVEISYLGKKRYVTVYTQIEKLVVIVLGTVTVFAVLLPLAINSTPVEIMVDGKAELKTLWDRTYEWFFSQIIPFLILLSYHVLRAVTEGGGHTVVDVDEDDAEEEDDE